jgi:hypothetical protein
LTFITAGDATPTAGVSTGFQSGSIWLQKSQWVSFLRLAIGGGGREQLGRAASDAAQRGCKAKESCSWIDRGVPAIHLEPADCSCHRAMQ